MLEEWPAGEAQAGGIDDSARLVQFLRNVLRRTGLAGNHRQLLAALYEAGDQGLLRTQIAERLGLKELQVSGVLGSLGRRIQGTPGVERAGRPGRSGTGHMMDFDRVNGIWRYRLIPEARQAIEEEDDTLHILGEA